MEVTIRQIICAAWAAAFAAAASGGAKVSVECESPAARSAARILEGDAALDGVEIVLRPAGADSGVRYDGYRVLRDGARYVVEGARPRSFLFAAGETARWLGKSETVRSPRFEHRLLNYGSSTHPPAEWIAATGCNMIHLGRNVAVSLENSMPEVFAALASGTQEKLRRWRRQAEESQSERVKACHEADCQAYPLLYGCNPLKWNRELAEAFLSVYPDARSHGISNSWEKGVFCPSSPDTWRFIAAYARDFATAAPYDGLVVTFWDDYGIRCNCARCRKSGMNTFASQLEALVKCLDGAVTPLGKKLIVRTWASGAPHWLRDEWVHAPGYASRADALETWMRAVEAASGNIVFQTKVYNSDCQPNPPFSHLLGECAGRDEFAEWQITGQTVGLQYLPASVAVHTAWTMRKAAAMPNVKGVCLYAGGYNNRGYEELDDIMNSCNLHIWRQLAWQPDDDLEAIWREWALSKHPAAAVENVVEAMKLSENAAVASFSPLGLGAPTESRFASNVSRREDLLRYTNRQYTPEGQAALAPTNENIDRVIAQKDAALADVERMRALFASAPGLDDAAREECLLRTYWLQTHLRCSKALDEALWRFRRIRHLAEMGIAEPHQLKAIDAAFDELRKYHKQLFACNAETKLSFYPEALGERKITLRSPVDLMRDIQECARKEQSKIVND